MKKDSRIRDFGFDVFDFGANVAYTLRMRKVGDSLRKVAVYIILGRKS